MEYPTDTIILPCTSNAPGWEGYSSWDMHVAHLLFCAKLVVIGSTLNYLMGMVGDKKFDLF